MGRYTVSLAHIRQLIKDQSRYDHGLAESDIDPRDKMNYRAVRKISSERVRKGLRTYEHTAATEMYLQIMDETLDSFLHENISAEKRIYLIWRSVFFLRLWRIWLEAEGYSTEANCVTLNTFTCIEINAHNLVAAVRRFRDEGTPELFLPTLFGSQSCEEFFRDARSLTSTNNTVVNFSMLELLRRLGRIELQSMVAHKLKNKFEFPR
jgi:hypothetical protein